MFIIYFAANNTAKITVSNLTSNTPPMRFESADALRKCSSMYHRSVIAWTSFESINIPDILKRAYILVLIHTKNENTHANRLSFKCINLEKWIFATGE